LEGNRTEGSGRPRLRLEPSTRAATTTIVTIANPPNTAGDRATLELVEVEVVVAVVVGVVVVVVEVDVVEEVDTDGLVLDVDVALAALNSTDCTSGLYRAEAEVAVHTEMMYGPGERDAGMTNEA